MKQTPLSWRLVSQSFLVTTGIRKSTKFTRTSALKSAVRAQASGNPKQVQPGARLPRVQFCGWVGNGSDGVGASQAVCPNTSHLAVLYSEMDAHTRTCGCTDRPSCAWRRSLRSFTENRCCDGKAQDVTDRPKCVKASLEDPFTFTHSQASPQFKVVTRCIAV